MASAFIEVSDRRDNTRKMVVNTDRIIKVADDGTGAILTILGTTEVEVHTLDETFATIKTALGL